LQDIAAYSAFPVIASGGITRVEDLVAVRSLGPRIEGAIVGKALYDGKLDYATALAAVGQE
jgi:phosphoribosylformimino-5-aminoimidazole carboxamide ribotide isomerase